MADVFISHARNDKSLADGRGMEKILKAVQPAVTYWRDAELTAGTSWNEEIRTQLRDCRCVIVLWSASSWQSTWVRQEAFYAYVRDILIPVRFGDVTLEPPFTHVQCIDGNQSIRPPLLRALSRVLGETFS